MTTHDKEIYKAQRLAESLILEIPKGTSPTTATFALSRALLAVMVTGLGRPPTDAEMERLQTTLQLHREIVCEAVFPN